MLPTKYPTAIPVRRRQIKSVPKLLKTLSVRVKQEFWEQKKQGETIR